MKVRLSLYSRFALGLGAVLLPFLVAAALGQFYLLPRMIDPLDEIVREVSEEMQPVVHLQMLLLKAAMPVNDYLIHGNPDERRQFVQLRDQVALTFTRILPERFTLMEERVLIESAHTEWSQAQRLSDQLLSLPNPVGNKAAARNMERLDAHIERAVFALEEMYQHFHRVIDQSRTTVDATRTKAMWVTFVAFVLATGISLLAGTMLVRPLLTGLGALRKATSQLARGDMSVRAVLDSKDEIGQLVNAFNGMVEKLEKNEMALHELAIRDGLTGLYNHREFYRLLESELLRAHRFNHPVALLLLDIDHFKQVNDRHGHLAGDTVLRELGQRLPAQVRAIDHVCRYGGEEVAMILPEIERESAIQSAERIRAKIAAEPFIVNGETEIVVTVSIGIAIYSDDGTTSEELVAATDAALYKAKEQGRNRVAGSKLVRISKKISKGIF